MSRKLVRLLIGAGFFVLALAFMPAEVGGSRRVAILVFAGIGAQIIGHEDSNG